MNENADDVDALDAVAWEARQAWVLSRDAERIARQRMHDACNAAMYARRRAGLPAHIDSTGAQE